MVLCSVLFPSSLSAKLSVELSLKHWTDRGAPPLKHFQWLPHHIWDKTHLLRRCPSTVGASPPALSLRIHCHQKRSWGPTTCPLSSLSSHTVLCLENCSLLHLQNPIHPLGWAQTALECGICFDQTPIPQAVCHSLPVFPQDTLYKPP